MGCGVWVGGDEGGRFTFETHHHYCYVYTSTDKLNANNFSSPNPTFFTITINDRIIILQSERNAR